MPLFPLSPVIAGNLVAKLDSYDGRLKPAAYTSPTNKRIEFQFVTVSRETTKRTVAFEFPEINDAYVQDNGFGARRYPMLCIFSGKSHDLIATAFEAALLERGAGRLEHPMYGTFTAIPFGDVVRRNDLVGEANQSIVEVTFWTTTGVVYPTSERSARNEILDAIEGFDAASAKQFESSVDVRSTISRQNMAARIRKWLRDVRAGIGSVAASVSTVNREFRQAQSLINDGIDTLVGTPLILARSISNLITAPARANAGIQSRLDGYHALANSIMTSTVVSVTQLIPGLVVSSERLKRSNDFHSARLFVESSVIGSIVSALNNTYLTHAEAVSAADQILAQLDEVIAWRDERFESLEQVDTGDAYQQLQRAAGLIAGYLIDGSGSLSGESSQAVSDDPNDPNAALQSGALATVPASILSGGRALVERRIVNDRARTVLDLCAELYGDPDADGILDFLINTNGFTSSELIELPKGREVKYYQ